MPDDELYSLLDQLNGVLFTGGGLVLFEKNGHVHQYYKTAKKIYEYSMMMKDKKNETFPLFGTC